MFSTVILPLMASLNGPRLEHCAPVVDRDEGVVVEGPGDGLAQVHVRGLLAPGVELDAERGQGRLGRRDHAVHLGERVELVGTEPGHEIRLALDEGGALGGGLADELVDDPAELALVALPVVLDPLELVQRAVLDAPELVRP